MAPPRRDVQTQTPHPPTTPASVTSHPAGPGYKEQIQPGINALADATTLAHTKGLLPTVRSALSLKDSVTEAKKAQPHGTTLGTALTHVATRLATATTAANITPQRETQAMLPGIEGADARRETHRKLSSASSRAPDQETLTALQRTKQVFSAVDAVEQANYSRGELRAQHAANRRPPTRQEASQRVRDAFMNLASPPTRSTGTSTEHALEPPLNVPRPPTAPLFDPPEHRLPRIPRPPAFIPHPPTARPEKLPVEPFFPTLPVAKPSPPKTMNPIRDNGEVHGNAAQLGPQLNRHRQVHEPYRGQGAPFREIASDTRRTQSTQPRMNPGRAHFEALAKK